jgi:hypothetical protein
MRGLETVAEGLRQAGHIVVDWRGPLKTQELLDVGAELFMSGGREDSKCCRCLPVVQRLIIISPACNREYPRTSLPQTSQEVRSRPTRGSFPNTFSI